MPIVSLYNFVSNIIIIPNQSSALIGERNTMQDKRFLTFSEIYGIYLCNQINAH